ncbi:hypothetical protein HYH02_005601 [Chlamydomonas schloesseri]|uniref:5'-nucleotidase n=1 Tax=Chlamydomonas schloesseri TaxID=2026947 RepID=A0A836B7D0_9CHLO|nr:hypothetical protein HYH02_005601 [Chlamydomonas schloesseri]|eukprot:KAG2449454.1 hypothetical protein HYH02_005601 [Chlamydomonas schloesseri]
MSGHRVCTRLFWRHARQLAQQQRTPFALCGSSLASASSASTFRPASAPGGAHRAASPWPFGPSSCSSSSSGSTALRCFGSSGSAAAPAAAQATPAVTEAAHASASTSSPASASGRDGAASSSSSSSEGPQRHVYATKGYGSHPPPRRGSVPLWTEDAIPRLPRMPLQRRIFCNRALNMKQIKAVGYDMDYTLAQYKPDTFEGLAHKETVSKLIEVFRYPEELRSLDFQWDYMTKGLIIDKERGNMLKVDRHNYVKVAYHGFEELSAEKRKAIYNAHGSTHSANGGGVFEEAGGYAMVDTLFSLAEAYLYMQLVDMKDGSSGGSSGAVKPGFEVLQRKSYKDLYRDLRTAVDMCHRDGSLKRAVAANPEKFIHRDENLVHILETQRAAGRTLFLATNSLFDYTNVVMNFLLLGKTGSQKTTDWLKYFDVVMVGCAKPSFFQHRAPLFSVDVNTGMLRNTDNGAPIIPIDEQDMSPTLDMPGGPGAGSAAAALRNPALAAATGAAALRPGAGAGLRAAALGCGGNVFQGGWYGDLHKMLGVTEGSQVLYIGDHIYGDIVKSKKDIGWRTMLVVPELELELEKAGRSAKMADELRQLRQLRDEYDDRIQRLKWSIAQSGAAAAAAANGGGGASKGPEAEEATRDAQQLLEAAEVDRAQLKARHSALLRAHHKQFHPIWGQLMKTGHQNSRFAHQIERYACLYTSHVCNLAFFSPDKSWMGRMDVMAHEAEGEVWDAVDLGPEGPGTPPSGGEMDVGV